MKKYLRHITTAFKWQIPYLDAVLGPEAVKKYENDQYKDVTITHHNYMYKSKDTAIHICKLQLPRCAVVRMGADYVSSPELLFLELANTLDIQRLILLGIQLCSHSPGESKKAITSKRKLSAFLEKTKGFNGHRLAVRALKYVAEGSNSIMESLAFMILTLPNKYGGFGLGGAVFNHEIPRQKGVGQYLDQRQFYMDIFYKGAKLAIEYDSLKHHSTSSEQSEDHLRATALERQGIVIRRFTSGICIMQHHVENLHRM